jgi:hypothetical protein
MAQTANKSEFDNTKNHRVGANPKTKVNMATAAKPDSYLAT